jgi:hypothetical protein
MGMEMKLNIQLDNKDKYNWSIALLKRLLKKNMITRDVYQQTKLDLQEHYKIIDLPN